MSNLDAFKGSDSKSFKKLNPHIFGPCSASDIGGEDDQEQTLITPLESPRAPKSKKRIRQSDKPLLNKLEVEFFNRVAHLGVKSQAVKFKLANNAFYKPDFFSLRLKTAWEVKGLKGKNIDRGKLALKVAASAWPEIKFILVWKDANGQWQEQQVLP